MRNLIALALFSLSPVYTFAAEFNYNLKSYPAQPAGCHKTAAEVGARFQQATGLAPLTSRCMADGPNGYTLQITYSAETPLRLVSTSQAWGALSPIGRYVSLDVCQAEMDRETKIFVEETGLKIALNFCSRDGISEEKVAWYPRIDAFGESKRAPYMSSYSFFGLPKGIDGKGIREKVFAGLQSRNIRPVAMVFRSHFAFGDAEVHYYAEDRIKLDMIEATNTDTVAQCLAQVGELAAAYAGAPNPPLVHYCGNPVIGSQTELNVLFTGKSPDVRTSVEKFASFTECETQRPALVKFYQETLKLPVRLGLCTRDKFESTYQLALFEERVKN